MNWREKANYLAKRASEKGGVWLIWLNGRPQDDPSKLGSTTDEEDLRDANHLELGHYGAGTTREQILADVAEALGQDPTGEAAAPWPKTGEPTPAGSGDNHVEGDGSGEALPEFGQEEREAPASEGQPKDPEPDPQVAASSESEAKGGEAAGRDSALPGYWQPGDTALAIARAQQQVQGEHESADQDHSQPEPPADPLDRLQGSTWVSVRAKLYRQWLAAHDHGPREARLLWQELIDYLDALEHGEAEGRVERGAAG